MARSLRILKYLDRSPTHAKCDSCNREFRTPLSALHKPSEALKLLKEMFDRHICKDQATKR
jgi:hypothetical protein